MALHRKQEIFCQAVARGLSQSAAAVEAGFAGSSGHRLMKLTKIQARIDELDAAIVARRNAEVARVVVPTRDYVLRELIENISDAKNAHDRASVNRGLELVGKEIGMFVTRSMAIESPLQKLPADRLVALLQLIERTQLVAEQRALPAPAATSPTIEIEAVIEPTDDAW